MLQKKCFESQDPVFKKKEEFVHIFNSNLKKKTILMLVKKSFDFGFNIFDILDNKTTTTITTTNAINDQCGRLFTLN